VKKFTEINIYSCICSFLCMFKMWNQNIIILFKEIEPLGDKKRAYINKQKRRVGERCWAAGFNFNVKGCC